MAILVHTGPNPATAWVEALQAIMPDEDIRQLDQIGDPDDIEALLAMRLPPGPMSRFPNMRFVGSITAAVDGLLGNPELSEDIPIVRCGAPGGDAEITEYTMLHVLRHHRRLPEYAEAQSRSEWIKFDQPLAAERRVGFMGLGLVARPGAEAVRDLGFKVAAWTRSPKDVSGIEIFQGEDAFDAFLARSDIIVNFLPVTDRTTNILNADLFSKLPDGAAVINIGRGEHLVEADLIAALDAGKLSAATLDVYRTEPLSSDDPLWTHPMITIMPHTSRRIRPANIVPQFAEAMRCLRAGEPLPRLVDRAAGY
jgi:glyoxylate/hydroxypyruvate reductase A